MSSSLERRRRIREALIRAEAESPGVKSRAERIAVFSVAIADRLGFPDDVLLAIRELAELRGLPESSELAPDSTGEMRGIIGLASKFVEKDSMWLQSEARVEFDSRLVDALEAVRLVISPAS